MTKYNQFTDAELLGLMRSGDRVAYTEIYHRYKFILHQHAWNKVRNKEEAQDILQEVFTQFVAKARNGSGK
jgi:DNA-directed RNA polymerase specialized sigma24 family protein